MTRILPSNASITQFDIATEYACAEQIAEGVTHKWDVLNRLVMGREMVIDKIALGSWAAVGKCHGVSSIEAFRAVNMYRAWIADFLVIDWSKPITLIEAEMRCGMRGSNGLYTDLFSGLYPASVKGGVA